MKRSLLFVSVGLGLMISSCKTGETDTTSNGALGAYNLITNLDNGETYVSTSSYQFGFNWTKYTGSVSTDNLIINNSNWKLSTDETDLYSYGSMVLLMPDGTFHGNSSLPMKDASFIIAPYVLYGGIGAYFNTTYVPGYPDKPMVPETLIAKYKIGDEYLVRTFNIDLCYYGNTMSTYPSADGMLTNSNKDINYRVVLDIENKKANLIIYNAKFSGSDREPVKTAILVEGLDLKFDSNGYTITGENIVPKIVEGNNTTPYDSYVFNNLTITTVTEDLSTINVKFLCAGIYSGDFTGSYFPQIKMPGEQ
ncbi:MAG: hypothetical protein J1E95_05315 [Muribaculaceae bacterium]|nr:hypothetical protein [Muribaculaceae bacterium]